MPLTAFPSHPDCTECKLHINSANPGVPTRALSAAVEDGAGADDTLAPRALVAIGMNPGTTEDTTNTCWCGWSGRLLTGMLTDFVEATPARGIDVYLTNTCRCRTPGTSTLTQGPRRKCFTHLRADLTDIVSAYGPGNVYLLFLGAEACWLATGQSIAKSVASQGVTRHLSVWPDGPAFPCFYTYHPAATAPGRDPALLGPIEDHLRYLRDSLHGTAPAPVLPLPADTLIAPTHLPPAADNIYSLDIETYGILSGKEQTVFHPARMVAVDHCPRSSIIVCCAIGWYTLQRQIHTAWYNLTIPAHRRALVAALGELPLTSTILGQNITFDLSCLRFCYPELAHILTPERFMLEDVSITNHLDSDVRPERSLKAQSRLFRTVDYDALEVSASRTDAQASSPSDPNLLLYNVADVIAALRARTHHLTNIREKYGPNHPALSDLSRKFRSDLVWLVLHMTEAGCEFSLPALTALHVEQSALCQSLILRAYSHNLILAGKGTQQSQRDLFTASATACDALNDERLELTQEKKEISTGKSNTNLLLGLLPLTHPLREPMNILHDYKTAAKLVSSYTGKLLYHPDEGCVESRAWPTWYPTPGYVKDSGGDSGGTKQGRFAAKKPAQQTLPPPVKKCRTSRYGDDGILADYDMSQQELRTAALLSGDPVMISTYMDPSRDIHTDTTLEIWPRSLPVTDKADPAYKDWHDKRQLGKRANFLIIYRGGPRVLIETARRFNAIEVPFPLAQQIVYRTRDRFSRLCAWQEELTETAFAQGYLVLLTGWTRTFGGHSREAVEDSYINEIANFPVQTIAAQSVQSAQSVILRARTARRLCFQMPQQDHDSITIDCHRSDWPAVDRLVTDAMLHPPLWHLLEQHLGRTVPVAVERTIIHKGKNVHD